MSFFLCALGLAALGFLLLRSLRVGRTKHADQRHGCPTGSKDRSLFPPKPAWVKKEVIRLKALMPHHGCRAISMVFNQLWEVRRGMTIGKTFVAEVIRDNQEAILRKRRELKHREPRPLPRNLAWGLDLTFVNERPIFGIVDHGTRACLALRSIEQKGSAALLRPLLEVIERFGRPRTVRTDNESCFTSWLFRFGLALLGIRHQRSAPMAPWQNGRIERFFATFKAALRHLEALGARGPELSQQRRLDEFRTWYNHLRPHQHLDGWTPAKAWAGRTAAIKRSRRPKLVELWDGVLVGYLFPS
jgi:transposase InsO family protein